MSIKSKAPRFNLLNSIAWARENLFNNTLNSILTVVITIVVVLVAFFAIRYILFQADWIGVTENQRFFYLGTYPDGEEWRLWVTLALTLGLIGFAFGIWGSIQKYSVLIGAMAVIMLGLGFSFVPDWLNAISFGLAVPFQTTVVNATTGAEEQTLSTAWLGLAGVLVSSYAVSFVPYIPIIGGRSLRSIREKPVVLVSVLVSVVIGIIIAILLQQGIFASSWGGFFVDAIVFSVGGGIIMMPLGLALALGRSSRYRVISLATTAYIEIIRAGPLVVWLVFTLFLWTSFFPFEPIITIRVMIMFGLFGAAYIAEVVRGGLQSIPRGQYEAAFSLNLTTFTTYSRIILPQAIRAVVPAIIGRYISIWKDTSLLAAIGITNLLGAGRAVTTINFENFNYLIEIYLAIAVIYWLISYAFSQFGKYTEKKLNL